MSKYLFRFSLTCPARSARRRLRRWTRGRRPLVGRQRPHWRPWTRWERRGAATRSVRSRSGRRSGVAGGGMRVARGRGGALVRVGGGVLLADAVACWSGGGGAEGERGAGEGLGRPVWVKGTTIWPPPSLATTRWSWLRSELAGRQRRPKRPRAWRPLPDRPFTSRNTPFAAPGSLELSPSASAGLGNGVFR